MSNDSNSVGVRQLLTPRTLIGGGSEGKIGFFCACGIDWLQVTFHVSENTDFLPDFLSVDGPPLEEVPGWIRQLNYTQCYQLVPGGFLMWNDTRPEQGKHLRLNGRELDVLRRENVHLDEMLFDWLSSWVSDVSARVRITRLDLFVDLLGDGYPVEPLGLAVVEKRLKTRSHVEARVSEGIFGDAWTVYVGKRQSGKMLRVYDKGREVAEKIGVLGEERTRIEVEFRGDYAKALFDADLSMVGLSRLVLNTAASMAPFRVAWWRDVVVSGNEMRLVSVSHDGEKNPLVWLEKMCFPALVRHSEHLDTFALLEPLCKALLNASQSSPKARRLLSEGLLHTWLSEAIGSIASGD